MTMHLRVVTLTNASAFQSTETGPPGHWYLQQGNVRSLTWLFRCIIDVLCHICALGQS